MRKYRPRVVCDPFCGSGTTLVEANALGIESVGCDLSQFNWLLTKVKTDTYDVAGLRREIEDILASLQPSRQLSLAERRHDYLGSWFAPRARRELLAYKALIPNSTYQDLLKVILSRAARSARRTTHFDLDFPKKPVTGEYYCHKHQRTCRPTDQALRFLNRYSLDALRRIEEYSGLRTDAPVTVIQGDSRDVEFPECDMVITSPPYVGLIDYHAQHRYAFELLGLKGYEELEIGASRKGNSEKAARKYIGEMGEAFNNVAASMPRGSRMVIVVHDRRDLYDALASRLGFTIEYRLQRHVNRRTGRRAGDFFEDVIVWRT